MIRIEGIPIVAARLAAIRKAAKAVVPSRPVGPRRRQKSRVPAAIAANLPPVTFAAQADPPPPTLTGVKNAASYAANTVAPGEIVVLFGQVMGPKTLTQAGVDSSTGRLATAVSGVRILFDGRAAPIWYVSDSQSAAIVPYEVAGQKSTQVQVEYNGVRSAASSIPVAMPCPASSC